MPAVQDGEVAPALRPIGAVRLGEERGQGLEGGAETLDDDVGLVRLVARVLDPTRVGRDASRIADEVIAHLAGQVGSEVTVTLEIEATLADGASDQIVRTVTENSRTLKFTSHGFETE